MVVLIFLSIYLQEAMFFCFVFWAYTFMPPVFGVPLSSNSRVNSDFPFYFFLYLQRRRGIDQQLCNRHANGLDLSKNPRIYKNNIVGNPAICRKSTGRHCCCWPSRWCKSFWSCNWHQRCSSAGSWNVSSWRFTFSTPSDHTHFCLYLKMRPCQDMATAASLLPFGTVLRLDATTCPMFDRALVRGRKSTVDKLALWYQTERA